MTISLKATSLLLILWFGLPMVQMAHAVNSDVTNEECHLKYGWADWAPLQYINASNQLTGVQIDLVRTVSQLVGCKIEYIKLPWTQIIQRLESGEIDFTANATENETRKKFAYFSVPYRRDTFSFWVKKENLSRYNKDSVEEIMTSGMQLGLISNQLYSPEIERWIAHPVYGKNISYSDEIDELLQQLQADKVDAIVEDAYIIAFRKRANGFSKNITNLSIKTFGYEVAFMFSKKTISKNRVEEFNQALRNLKKTKAFQSIWLDPDLIP